MKQEKGNKTRPAPPLFIFAASLERSGPVIEITVGLPAEKEAALRAAGQPVRGPLLVQAMVDTGASVTVIRTGLARLLDLQPVGLRTIHSASHNNVRCAEYRVRLTFPDGHTVETGAVEAPLAGQHVDALIGRDVLARMKLIYLGFFNLFVCGPDGKGCAIPAADPECPLSGLRREFELALNRLIEGELEEQQRLLQEEAERQAARRSQPRRKRQEKPKEAARE